MVYRVDDGIDTWPESIRAGRAAMGLYLMCGAWICRGISNGTVADAVVPVEVATMYGTREWIARLVSVGLWTHVEDGYADRRYFDQNPTPEKVAADRKAKKERQERWLEKNRPKGKKPETRPRRTKDASQDATRGDALPLPSLKEGEGKERAPATQGAALAPSDAVVTSADPGVIEVLAQQRAVAARETAKRGAAAARAAISKPRRPA